MRSQPVKIRYSKRARRARIVVGPWREVEVVMPPGRHRAEAERLIAENQAWLERKLQWASQIESTTLSLGLDRPGLVWIDGRPRPLPVIAGQISPGCDSLVRWYRRRARESLTAATAAWSEQLSRQGLLHRAPGRISIRDPRTRWASCSSRGNISYSWRLVMVPQPVREYVVVHELCHLEVHDHSPAFWQLLAAARPRWRQEADWLKRHGLAIGRHQPRPGPPTALPQPLPDACDASDPGPGLN